MPDRRRRGEPPEDDWGRSPDFDWEHSDPPVLSDRRRREREERRAQLRRRRIGALVVLVLILGLGIVGVVSATSGDGGSSGDDGSSGSGSSGAGSQTTKAANATPRTATTPTTAGTTATTSIPKPSKADRRLGIGLTTQGGVDVAPRSSTTTTATATTATTTSTTKTTAAAKPSPRQAELDRENAAIDKLLERTWFISRGSKRKRQIALTFDDGPGPYTRQVARILEQYHVPATFFQVGFMIPEFPDAERALIQHGFTLGDHTEQHPNLAGKPAAFQRDQIGTPMEWLHKVGAPTPRLFRAPYGSWDKTTVKVLQQKHLLAVFWTIDTDDWRQPGTQAIVQAVLGHAGPGDIVLMHDAGGTRTQTVAALPAIIKGLRKRGYTLVSVPRMIADDPPPRHQRQPIGLEGG